jgi:transposase-like protein
MGQWAEIMRRRVESGLNIKAFCEREGIKTDRYHYWQRKLREAASEILPIEAEKVGVPPGWAQINTTVPTKPGLRGVMVEIGRFRVQATEDSDMELLAKVCKSLVEIC